MTRLHGEPPHSVDVYVGGRMRLRRVQLGLSQGELARRVGVSFQAVQKYESGDIRISASRLYDVAVALEVAPGFFFEGYPDGVSLGTLAEQSETKETFDRHEIAALVRGFYGIKDETVRANILRLVGRLGHRQPQE
jgi:transcriptional regulator with XRE-family HTH domain